MSVIKVVELIGTSPDGFHEAFQEAFRRASATLRGISGIDLIAHKAVVRDNKITEYRAVVKVAFAVEEE